MKNFTSILVFVLCAFAAQPTLNAQIQNLLSKGAQSLRQLEGAPQMNNLHILKDDNKKVTDRDDPIFRLRATRSDRWENGWVGADSVVNVYDNQGNQIQTTSKRLEGSVWKNYEQYFRKYNANNNVTEVVFQVWDGVIWANTTRDNFGYDINYNRTESIRYKWDGATWVNFSRNDLEYDQNNNLTLNTGQTWNGSTWINLNRTASQYDGNDNITLRTNQNWDGVGWKSINRTVYEYDADGENTLFLSQAMNGGVWENTLRVIYQYTGTNLTLELSQQWNSNNWINSSQWIREYTANGSHASTVRQNWTGSSWVNSSYITSEYNSHDDLSIRKYFSWENSTWEILFELSYNYDVNNNLVFYLEDYIGLTTISDYRVFYYYDSFENTHTSTPESFTIQAFPNPSNGTFFLNTQELEQQPCQVFLYDQLGRQCFHQSCSGLALEAIDGSHLPNGVYILRVIALDGKQAVRQIQISK